MNPLISVVIPVYNKAAFVEATLKSIADQSYENFEIIIVNDGSTDDSLDCIEAFFNSTEKKLNYNIISQVNKGLSNARNTGIEHCNGKLVFFLDADDFWHEEFLKRMVYLFNIYPDTNCFGSRFRRFKNRNDPSKQSKVNSTELIVDFFKTCRYGPYISQSSFGFKKSLYPTIKYDESIDYAEDIDMYIQLFQTETLAIDHSELVFVRTHVDGQMTSTDFTKKRIINLDKYESIAKKNKSLKRFIDFYRYCFGSDYKALGNIERFKIITKPINPNNLNTKQKTLLALPPWLLKTIKSTKRILS
ncbi:glycosyltransferase family 2 protein [Winogradskyella maritima]|uniref:Glycosyltransferase family 2 protein n=1 Tax=Winogradskyella maritima TaxID=1517766 RepID=A0ABV8AG92_9FLAO|nr:glycosyltransferase family 2 protein [Winogradskyella maritima]